jgi:predicted ABC-type ATPase
MSSERRKNAVMIGGPNGAGKTSWAYRQLPSALSITEFVNADEIARGLSPLDPESSPLSAGRLMIARLNQLVDEGHDFAFETTCSGRGHARLLRRCRSAGYLFTVIFLWLPSAQIAIERVARRIKQGGHRIPADVIVRRYLSGLRNMREIYLPLADEAFIYDNSDGSGLLIAERRETTQLIIHDQYRWDRILEAAQ